MKIYTTTDALLTDICDLFNTPVKLIRHKAREKDIVKIRHYYFYIAANYYKFGLVDIGKQAGNKDHTTVINGRNRIKKLLESGDIVALSDIHFLKKSLEITDNTTLDYGELIAANNKLLQTIQDLKKENIKLSHEILKLKRSL